MDIEWNPLEIWDFSSNSVKASGCRSTPTVGPRACFGRWVRKLVEPGKAYYIVCRTELCCADRGAVFFYETCQFWSAPTETLSRVFRFYLALSGMMPAYSCNHMLDSSVAPKIIYWTAYGCIKFCNLVAYSCTHVSLTTVKSSFETVLLHYSASKHSTFQRLFHNW